MSRRKEVEKILRQNLSSYKHATNPAVVADWADASSKFK